MNDVVSVSESFFISDESRGGGEEARLKQVFCQLHCRVHVVQSIATRLNFPIIRTINPSLLNVSECAISWMLKCIYIIIENTWHFCSL